MKTDEEKKGWWNEQSPKERILFMVATLEFFVLAIYLYDTFMNGGFRETISDDGTRTLILLLAGTIGWYFLLRRTRVAEHSAKIAEQGLNVDRLTNAMKQLGDVNSSIRMGGILGLEQIAETQKDKRKEIIQILSERIRELATRRDDEAEIYAKYGTNSITIDSFDSTGLLEAFLRQSTSGEPKLYNYIMKVKKEIRYGKNHLKPDRRKDIEAAVNTLAYIASGLTPQEKLELCDLQNIDLHDLCLDNVDLSYFNLVKTDFFLTRLKGAKFNCAKLAEDSNNKATFAETHISGADFRGAEGFDLFPKLLTKALYLKGQEPLLPDKAEPPEVLEPIEEDNKE